MNQTINQEHNIQDFIKAIHQAGLAFKGQIMADGTIHRFSTGKKSKKNGWYVFYGMAGAFGVNGLTNFWEKNPPPRAIWTRM